MPISFRRFTGFCLLFLSLFMVACEKEDPIDELPPEAPEAIDPVTTRHGALYNYRYCEILMAVLENGAARLDVYNTMGCDRCKQDDWEAVDLGAVATDNGALVALPNGPRNWVLDSISSGTISGACDYNLGGLDMALVAAIELSLGDLPTGGVSDYQSSSVLRNTVFYYFAGTELYILEDPAGKCYVMQSYCRIVDQNLALDDLPTLGERLNLPSGWAFKTHRLTEDFALPSENGIATVLQDDLDNTYQYLPICF